jgi:hypothetical protein
MDNVGKVLIVVRGSLRRCLVCGLPQKNITDAQIVEMVWRHSQCILNQMGKCPLLVFGNQLADELNEFFGADE